MSAVNGRLRRIVAIDQDGWAHWEEIDPASGRVLLTGRTSADGTMTYAVGRPAADQEEEDDDDLPEDR